MVPKIGVRVCKNLSDYYDKHEDGAWKNGSV